MKTIYSIFLSAVLLTLLLPLIESATTNSVSAFSASAQAKRQTSKRAHGKRLKIANRKIAGANSRRSALNLPSVKQIDSTGLRNLVNRDKENPRPLLVNFWATWCDPCQAEFPELVKIDAEYRKLGLDFVVVSVDDLAEIKRDVPKFLTKMKATMPAYLLKTEDVETAIGSVTANYEGGLPYTVLYDAAGKIAYSKRGVVKPQILRREIEKILQPEGESQNVPNN